MSRIDAFKFIWQQIKAGEDYSSFNNKELAGSLLYTYMAVVINFLLFIWLDNFVKWFCLVLLIGYTFRMYKLKKFLGDRKINFQRKKDK